MKDERFAPVIPLTGSEMLRALLGEGRNQPVGEETAATDRASQAAGVLRSARRTGR